MENEDKLGIRSFRSSYEYACILAYCRRAVRSESRDWPPQFLISRTQQYGY